MQRRILLSNIDGKPAICYSTGLDPRSFARTKMSQSLIEPGYVVHQDGSHETVKAGGVSEFEGRMIVWWPTFTGERLDEMLSGQNRQSALQAVVYWLRAKMLFGETTTTLNPGAVFVSEKGDVFFGPANLSNRCLYMEDADIDTFNCPDLFNMEAAAFCAAVMLYKVLSKEHPYSVKASMFQDMREGVFLPVRLAAPGLNNKLCSLIEESLYLPAEKKRSGRKGIDIISDLLSLLTEKDNTAVSVSSLFNSLTDQEKASLQKEKKNYLSRQHAIIKTKRFLTNNKTALWITAACVVFAFIIVFSTFRTIRQRPTTENMTSNQVIHAYYDAFSSLNHIFMEACINGADKADINIAASYYAITKSRQAYEMSTAPSLIPARVWKETGGELPAPNVFGVTDIKLEHLSGSESSDMMIFRADYLLWSPDEQYARRRSDILTLRRDRKKHWRITEILRTEY